MAKQRYTDPSYRPGGTRFSDDRGLLSVGRLIELVKELALWPELKAATTVPHTWGRKRLPGEWSLIHLAYVVCGKPALEPWWSQTENALWRRADFYRRPSFTTTYDRFRELEQFSDAYEQAAQKLIRLARSHEPRIGCHVHVDSTEAETHAGLVHDCRDGDACPEKNRPAQRPERVSTVDHRQVRHREDELDEQAPRDTGIERRQVWVDAEGRRYLRLLIGGHWYRTLDTDAGARAYSGPRGSYKFWLGYYNQKAVDHFTGAPLAIAVEPADRQEYYIYPGLYQRLSQALGGAPETVTFDKGFAVGSVFEHNTRRGIATIAPQRPYGDGIHDTELRDRDGHLRCRHCGGDTVHVRFNHLPTPRLWVRCVTPQTAACRKEQSRACSADWRELLPLRRTSLLFQEIYAGRTMLERVHRHWRERYMVAGDTLSNRPKRIGVGVQRLRAQAALFVEWLRVCWRHGWLPGSMNRNHRAVKRLLDKAKAAVAKLDDARRAARLHEAYGEQAAALGIGERTPPSRR